jgi:hypothetical protein
MRECAIGSHQHKSNICGSGGCRCHEGLPFAVGLNYECSPFLLPQDIFRKYPHSYEAVIPTLCSNLDELDEPEAKASLIWIIGEYAEKIENANELLAIFVDSFVDEAYQVLPPYNAVPGPSSHLLRMSGSIANPDRSGETLLEEAG